MLNPVVSVGPVHGRFHLKQKSVRKTLGSISPLSLLLAHEMVNKKVAIIKLSTFPKFPKFSCPNPGIN